MVMGYGLGMVKRFYSLVLCIFWLFLPEMGLSQSIRPGWGATPFPEGGGTGVTFRIWAPNATNIYVAGTFNGWNTNQFPLVKESPATNGIWSVDVPVAKVGDQFKYSINHSIRRRDPRARQVVHSGEAGAVIYDPAAYRWKTREFIPPAHGDLVVYEMHIGTYGWTFAGAAARLDHVAALGANAVQLMPVAEFAGNNSWGYNPSDPFAVESSYGGPDGLKLFVDACHERGIAVLLDTVHNHYGPDDLENSLWNVDGWSGTGGGIYFYQDAAKKSTKWGPRPDYSRPQVREYIKDNIRMWIEEYRIDGFRWDATLFMRFTTNFTPIAEGASLLREINQMLAMEYPEKISIAEDHVNDGVVTAPLSATNGLGFHSEWLRSFHVAMSAQITNDANRNLNVMAGLMTYTGGVRRLIYLESHDESGDHNAAEGALRFPAEIAPTNPAGYVAVKKSTLAAALMMAAPGIPMVFQGQEMLEDELFSDLLPVDWTKTNTHAGVVNFYRDVIALRHNSRELSAGLSGASTTASVTNEGTMLLVRRGITEQPEHDVFIIANFSTNYVEGYWIDFPTSGTWYVHVNSDSTNYSAGFDSWGSTEVFAWDDLRGNPYIAPWSVLVLSRHPHAWLDTDRDGMPDTWEAAFGLDPLNPHDAWRNPDGDAYSNVEEFRAGTHPFTWNQPKSDYNIIAVAGDFNGWNPESNHMARISDHLWQLDRAITNSRIEFKFAANSGWDDNWGIVSQSVHRAPITLAASFINDNIILSNLTAGVYRFRFNEQSLAFTVRAVPYADSDMDGLTDDWERTYGFDALSTVDAFANPDGDLYDNQEEFRRGSNPIVWDPPLTAYNNLRIQGSFAPSTPFMSQDASNHYIWTFTTNIVQSTGLTFRFIANGDPNLRWAMNAANTLALPAGGTSVFGGNFFIAITQSFNGTFRFTFNEQTRVFAVATVDADTDGDGLPDWWETLYFGGATNAIPDADPDEDGATNHQEFIRNTNPLIYDVPPANYAGMAVAGSFNGWNPQANMGLIGPHLWRLKVTLANAVDPEFKFTANGIWNDNWGHNHQSALPMTGSGIKNLNSNMRIAGAVNGTLVFTFNDATLLYSVAYDATHSLMSGGFASGNPGGPLIIRWSSASNQVYRLLRGTNLNRAFSIVAPTLPATPPENAYTDTVQNADAVFYQIIVNP